MGPAGDEGHVYLIDFAHISRRKMSSQKKISIKFHKTILSFGTKSNFKQFKVTFSPIGSKTA
jgi:hypothetical protein